jgi:hypothetical protein
MVQRVFSGLAADAVSAKESMGVHENYLIVTSTTAGSIALIPKV